MNNDSNTSPTNLAWDDDSLIKHAKVGGTVLDGPTNPKVTRKEFVTTSDGRYFVQIIVGSEIRRTSQPVSVEEFVALLDVGDYLLSNGSTQTVGGFRYDRQPDGSWRVVVIWRS
ncbi:hypothetical protein [Pseudomonas frederiksbergensis]|uniref:hypothetical protein n=1 Tax=Pseudomonas frederiksbergensis TaxID=104087 RepID=UPI000F480ABE|nr:hypothetical protein [Pseudomonas frederiksbergensis]RON58922.1 hypothetical protein BK667_00950 [Pseudomonas frederiksbergensis]